MQSSATRIAMRSSVEGITMQSSVKGITMQRSVEEQEHEKSREIFELLFVDHNKVRHQRRYARRCNEAKCLLNSALPPPG